MITVVLNAFKRQDYLDRQIACVLSQSIAVEKIFVWNNGQPLNPIEYDKKVVIANNSQNLGVWSRFAFALNADTEYVCVLDDDTFPGELFFQNCLEQMKKQPALYGARGLRFLSAKRYEPFISFGWDSPNNKSEVVDIVGHAWFFKREWLSAFWREQPNTGVSRLVGEDIHFSYMLQKYMGIKTMVPPHPQNNKSIWGSDPVLAEKLGTSDEAISQGEGALLHFDLALQKYTKAGFKLQKDLNHNSPKELVLGPGISRMRYIQFLAKKYPKFNNLGRRVRKKLSEFKIHI